MRLPRPPLPRTPPGIDPGGETSVRPLTSCLLPAHPPAVPPFLAGPSLPPQSSFNPPTCHQEMIGQVSSKPIHKKKLLALFEKYSQKEPKKGVFGKLFGK